MLLPIESGSPRRDENESLREGDIFRGQGARSFHQDLLKAPKKIGEEKILSLELPSAFSSMSSYPSMPPPPPPPHGHAARVSTTTAASIVENRIVEKDLLLAQSQGRSPPARVDIAPPIADGGVGDHTGRSQETESTEYFG